MNGTRTTNAKQVTTQSPYFSRIASGINRGTLCRVACRVAIVGLFMATAISGCTKSESEDKVPPAEVKVVEAYGVKLDAAASPQEVLYVFLRSVVDDYAAAKAKNAKAQREAQLTTYSLAAPKTIEERLIRFANIVNPELKKTSLGQERDEKIYQVTHSWAPTVGHYVPSFANVDLATVQKNAIVALAADGQTAHVFYPASHDPTAEPAKQEPAIINIEMVREKPADGGEAMWRIAWVQFAGKGRMSPTPVTTPPPVTTTTPNTPAKP